MPELPEVETIVRDLREIHLEGRVIKEVEIIWPRSIATHSAEEFTKRLKNQKIIKIDRRGKYIVFYLIKDVLLVHLRMTGKFILSKENKKPTPTSHERIRLTLDDGRILHYEDQRKFGKWFLVSNANEKFKELGLEPLSKEFTFQAFQKLLESHSQKIKPFLLNQKFIAGLGNIYVDEALWASKIHPNQKVNELSANQIKALYRAIPNVLEQGIMHMGTTLGSKNANYFSVSGRRGGNQTQLKVFRREGMPCPRCHEKLIKIRVAQRGTHLCPRCQRLT